MTLQYYTEKDFKTSLWSGGKTTECFIFPPGSSYTKRDFAVRLSSATVDCSISNFTHLGGITRYITCLSSPILLEVGDDVPRLLHPFEVFQFSGEVQTKSYGLTRDFNMMINESLAEGWMMVSPKDEAFSINVKKGSTLWFFNFLRDCKLTINEDEYSMQAFSLFVMQDLEESQFLVHTKGAFPLIYGCFRKR